MKVLIFAVLLTVSGEQKRLVLHSDQDINEVLRDLKRDINATKQENLALKSQIEQTNKTLRALMDQEIQALYTQISKENSALNAKLVKLQSGHGSTYVRWGRTVCGGNETEKVYSGFAAGSNYASEGGAASYICLPQTPTWAQYTDGLQNIGGQVYGTEYQTGNAFEQKAFGKDMLDQDAPCVVCHSSRSATIMIPGSTSCFSGWAQEYTGYLMTGRYTHTSASDYACVDKNPEAVYHGEANTNGKLFYFTEVRCGTLPCQAYPQGRELACVVCSK